MAKITESEILEVINNALKLKSKSISLDSSMQNIKEWDSLGHLGILVDLDKFYDGKIGGIKDLVNADSVGKILIILKSN
jgi:acyl carrier protein